MAISTLSNVLSKALDRVGANKWSRKKHYEFSMLACIQGEFKNISEDGVHIYHKSSTVQAFGSMVEGTTTPEMGSDIDIIKLLLNDVIEKDIDDKDVTNRNTVGVVADMFTPPGYVKIKTIKRDCSVFEYLLKKCVDGSCFVMNDYTDKYKSVAKIMMQEGQTQKDPERHGPALTCEFLPAEIQSFESADIIFAFRCKSGLSFTKDFFHRTRKYGWPSQATIDIMKGQGCLLVPKGHSHCESIYQNLHWRNSFSFQERRLMLNLNSAQFKCYILLKLVKKSHISPIVDLTSYHCKTALFYTIENTPCEVWNEDNLLSCFNLCLKRMKRWAKRHFCPNYFIPELNLFAGKIQEQDMYKLTDILSSLIKYPLDFILRIPIDNFGKLVQSYTDKSSDGDDIEVEIDANVTVKQLRLLSDTTLSLLSVRQTILQKISFRCDNINEIITRHYKWLKTIHIFQEINSIGPYTLDGVQWALPHVCRFLHSSVASHLAIKAIETEDTVMKTWYSVTAAYHYWMGLDSDAMSGKLKLVTILLFNGHLNMETQESSYWPTINKQSLFSICCCKDDYLASPFTTNEWKQHFLNDSRQEWLQLRSFRLELLQLNTSQFIEKYVSACTIFLPSEIMITPYPLKFEMYRSFGPISLSLDGEILQTKRKMRGSDLDYCVTLDSKIYAMLPRIYTSDEQEFEETLQQLRRYSSYDYCPHRETLSNILGWLASAEEINLSLLFYKQSWDYTDKQEKQRPPHKRTENKNAAKWHLALLLYRVWLERNQRHPS